MANDSKDLKTTLQSLLPREINGWKAVEKDEFYDPQTIFDYINGAGEVYRSYNFKFLLARRFSKMGQPDLVVDLFDMDTSEDAFGVFTHDLEGEEAGVGQGSTYKGGLLSFWKASFFVSIYAEEETEEATAALFSLGRKVDSAITKEGTEPEVVSFLPRKNLAEKAVHYFHNQMILNYHFYLSDENILLLDQKTEAALGIYTDADDKNYLLLIRYPEEGKASQAYEKFVQAYMPDAQEPGLVQTEDKKWTFARLRKNFIIAVFNASSASSSKEAVGKVEKRLS